MPVFLKFLRFCSFELLRRSLLYVEYSIFDFGWISTLEMYCRTSSPDSGVNRALALQFLINLGRKEGHRRRGWHLLRNVAPALARAACSFILCPAQCLFPLSSSFPSWTFIPLCTAILLLALTSLFHHLCLCNHASEPCHCHGHCGYCQRACWSHWPGSPSAPSSPCAP
jgi:hypothetical protein